MDYVVENVGLRGKLAIRMSKMGNAQLLLDGVSAPKGPKRGTYLLQKTDGTQATAKLATSYSRVVPTLDLDGVKHEMGPKVPTGFIVLSLLPLGLLAVGGALGGACGAGAWMLNQSVIRSSMSNLGKITVMLGLTAAAIILWLIFVTIFQLAINK